MCQFGTCSCAVRYSVRPKGSNGEPLASSSADGDVMDLDNCKPRAFQIALKTMKEGEKATLLIKPECEESSSS